MSWTAQGVRRLMCGLRGHDAVLHFERHRLSLQCVRCGHKTVGWQIGNDRSHSGSMIHAASIKPSNIAASVASHLRVAAAGNSAWTAKTPH